MSSPLDVLVIGAGPAGSAAAYWCANAGLTTLLVDRSVFPRDKVCGDGLTPRALRALERLGVGGLADEFGPIAGIRLVAEPAATPAQFAYEAGSTERGAVVPRRVLDDRIRRAAVAEGAAFRDGMPAAALCFDEHGNVRGVYFDTPSGRALYEARCTIIADGSNGKLSRQLCGGRRGCMASRGFAVRQYVRGIGELSPCFEIHRLPATSFWSREGYAWVFPVAAGVANVGLGILSPHNAADDVRVTAELRAFVSELMHTDARFARAEPCSPIRGGVLNTVVLDPFTLPGGVLVVGDGAGLVNPFTGEGIANALESGEVAARAAIAAFTDGASRGATTRFASVFSTSYRRFTRLRVPPGRLRWLMLNASGARTTAETPVAAIVRRLIVDAAGDTVAGTHAEGAGSPLIEALQRLVAARLRRTDALVAEVARELIAADECAIRVPLTVAACIGRDDALSEAGTRRALTTVALFLVADLVLSMTNDHHDGQFETTLALTLGDCLLSEATACASGLPDPLYRAVTSIFLGVARERALSRDRIGETFSVLAEPAVLIAHLVATGTAPPATPDDSLSAFVRWYAATSYALAARTTESSAEVDGFLRGQLDRAVPEAEPVIPMRLTLLGRSLVRQVRSVLGNAELGTIVQRA